MAAFAGLFLLSVIYLLGEAGATWIGAKDKVTDPWHKRLLHLFILLAFIGFVMVVGVLVFKQFGIIKT